MAIRIPTSDDVLLAQCDVDTFRSSGPGGQNVNRRATAVRLTHRPTGIVVTCQDERSQYRNKRIALDRLRRRLSAYLHRDRPRVPTRMPRRIRANIMANKRRNSERKRLRRRPSQDD